MRVELGLIQSDVGRGRAIVPDSMSTVSMTMLRFGRAYVGAIRSGNVQMFFPECNLLIRAGERDASGVPDYNAVVEVMPAP